MSLQGFRSLLFVFFFFKHPLQKKKKNQNKIQFVFRFLFFLHHRQIKKKHEKQTLLRSACKSKKGHNYVKMQPRVMCRHYTVAAT